MNVSVRVGAGAAAVPAGAHERRRRVWRVVLAVALVVGTLLGVVGTSLLALLLAAPRLLASGLAPLPESAALGLVTAPEVSGPATTALLWLLGLATLVLAAAFVTDARWIWRAYAAWAITGGMLAAYALVANWALAPETGFVALLVGAAWSATIALGIARTAPGTAVTSVST